MGSRSKSKTSATTVNETLTQQGVEGDALGITGNNNQIVYTDYGAVQGAFETNETNTDRAFDFGEDALKLADSSVGGLIKGQENAFTFADRISRDNLAASQNSMDSAFDFAGISLDEVGNAFDRILEFGMTNTEQSYNFAKDTQLSFGKTLGNTTAQIANTMKTENAQLADNVIQSVVKVVGIGGAVFVAYKVLR